MSDLETWIVAHIAELVGVRPQAITVDLELTELGLSSSQTMEIVYELEERLETVFCEDDVRRVQTVGDYITLAMSAGDELVV